MSSATLSSIKHLTDRDDMACMHLPVLLLIEYRPAGDQMIPVILNKQPHSYEYSTKVGGSMRGVGTGSRMALTVAATGPAARL